ncbi:MAG: GGDEF domain-containing protein [Rhizobiaceae bacterium]|nr:GGDEF domain-containing protein [Rhizobiaceae bacterium]
MDAKRKRISLSGKLKIAGWTFLGTFGCTAVSVIYTWIALRDLGGEALRQSLISAVVLPIILAGPLFLYITTKRRELEIANLKLAMLAATDSLTACLNRRAFSARVDGWLAAPAQTDAPVTGALLVVDADHFKKINDNHGHDIGDEALKAIANAIQASVRSGDFVGRLGGEEFGVFLPGATPEGAREIAECVRRGVGSTIFHPKGELVRLSVSVGCATFVKPADFSVLFRIADERLYRAKNEGRNRVLTAHLSDRETPTLVPALH